MELMSIKKKYIDMLYTVVLWAMAICYFFIISLFSSHPAPVSSSESRPIVEKSIQIVTDVVVAAGNEAPTLSKLVVTQIVRKAAHLFNFAILGFLYCMAAYKTAKSKRIFVIFAAMLCGLIGAVIDEAHQLFVGGRSGQISDILIDFLGACTGCMIFVIGKYFIYKTRGFLKG